MALEQEQTNKEAILQRAEKENIDSGFNFKIKMISPKIVIDEYLLFEKV